MVCAVALAWLAAPLAGAAEISESASAEAAEAIRLLESADSHEQHVGFLRLEALREPVTAHAIKPYIDSADPTTRARSVRALAAIEGIKAIELLLDRARNDRGAVVRRAALLALEPLRAHVPERYLTVCIAALLDRNTETRMTAVDLVSRIDDPRAREAIRSRERREQRRDVRRVLKMAMERLGEE